MSEVYVHARSEILSNKSIVSRFELLERFAFVYAYLYVKINETAIAAHNDVY